MDAEAQAIFDEAFEGLANPGLLGDRKLADAAVERRPDPKPAPVKVMSAEEREIAFLLAYDGDDPGLLWRKWHTEREQERRQETERRAVEARERAKAAVQAQQPKALTAADLAEHDEVQRDVHGAMIAHQRKHVAAEIAKLQAIIDGLTLRLDAMEHASTKQRQIETAAQRRDHERGGEVVDMLQPWERRRSAG